jgi:hypothetical protein
MPRDVDRFSVIQSDVLDAVTCIFLSLAVASSRDARRNVNLAIAELECSNSVSNERTPLQRYDDRQ